MERFFSVEIGTLEINSFYADNEMYCQEVRFSVPAGEWSEFERSPMYQQLMTDVQKLQTRYMQSPQTQDLRIEGNDKSLHHSTQLDRRESFWARVRRKYLKM